MFPAQDLLTPGQDEMPDGQFLLPVCTTRERLSRALCALYEGRASIPAIPDDPESGANLDSLDHMIDFLEALAHIGDPESVMCYVPSTPDGSSCVSFQPDTPFIGYTPNDPFRTPDVTPEGYLLPPFYTNPAIPLPGVQPGDAMVNFLAFPLPGDIIGVVESGLPRIQFRFSGSGEIEIDLVRVPQGGLCLVTMDTTTVRKVVDLNAIGLGDVLSLETIFDIFIDGDGIDTETIEIDVMTSGEHVIDITFLPNLGGDEILGFGGGLREIRFCADVLPGDPVMPIFYVDDCKLYYKPNADADADELVDFTDCIPSLPSGLVTNVRAVGNVLQQQKDFGAYTDIYDLNTIIGLILPQTTLRDTDPAHGLQYTLNGGSSYVDVAKYYWLDASRKADHLYAQNASASMRLYNAGAVQKLAMLINGSGVDMDIREAAPFRILFGAGATNNRLMYFNGDGTFQLVNTVVTPKAKFDVYLDTSSLHGLHVEGRTGLANGKAVLHLSALNQSGGSADGDAIFVQGVNDLTYTLSPGIFRVDRYGSVDHGDTRINRSLATATPKVTRNAYREKTVLLDESGSAYRSRMIQSAYVNNTPSETMRHEVIGGNPAIGVLGHDASNVVDVGTIDCEGSAGAKAALDALKTFGWIVGTINLGTAPEPPEPEPTAPYTRSQIASRGGRFIMELYLKAASDVIIAGGIFATEQEAAFAHCGGYLPKFDLFSTWAEELALEFGSHDPNEHTPDVEAYLETLQEQLYCAMPEGCWTSGSFSLLNAQFTDMDDDLQFFYQYMRAFEVAGIGAMISQGMFQYCNLDRDLTGTDCDTWNVFMDFPTNAWSSSVELVFGAYTPGEGYTGTYTPDPITTPMIRIPFHITRAEITTYQEFSSTSDAMYVRSIGGIDYTFYTPLAGGDLIVWEGDATTGLEISHEGNSGHPEDRPMIVTINLFGVGTAPTP